MILPPTLKPSFSCRRLILCGLLIQGLAAGYGFSAEGPDVPLIAPASEEAERAISAFQVPEGASVQLFAAEPMLANPVAFSIAPTGQVYVCETFRQQKGVEDNRNHMNWLHDDLALQTVDDRVAMFRNYLGDSVQDYARQQDRLRLISDQDGDGRADSATVFAEGFHAIEEGTGAGVLIHDGDVFYTCIPKLWKLRDSSGDGKADSRDVLANGFGVRVAFRGHDMHGLQLGPEGRIYFSIGDRGYNVKTAEGEQLARPDTGAVFRCEPDGSRLEVYAYGLRNPQELAFDDYGNLFTGDNNSDGGDQARWVYVVEGGDTGWRMYYQYLNDRGPWNREHIWHPYRENPETTALQPAYIIPPLANLGDGPSGLTYFPGTGLPDRYQRHFFLADFRGSAANSGVRSFSLEPVGASFRLTDSHWFAQRILATDVDFTPTGQLMVSDWVDGWDGAGKGRLYTLTHAASQSETKRQVANLLAHGLHQASPEDLLDKLGHVDRRIRQLSQFELARRQEIATISKGLEPDRSQLVQIHALWCLWQIGRVNDSVQLPLLQALAARDPEVRAQAAKIVGELHLKAAEEQLIDMLRVGSPREKYYAAIALGHLQSNAAVGALADLLAINHDDDPMLRHAAVMGLTGVEDRSLVRALSSHGARSVRLAVVLVMRRWQDPEMANFLKDSDPEVVIEAARAIHDLPVTVALPALAELADQPIASDALLRRVMNANYRLGETVGAERLAKLAASESVPETLRFEAVEELLLWDQPPVLDRVTNEYRPVGARPPSAIQEAVRRVLPPLLNGPDRFREAAARLAGRYRVAESSPVLARFATDSNLPAGIRIESLKALGQIEASELKDVVHSSLVDANSSIRSEARRLLVQIDPDLAVKELGQVLAEGEIPEKQAALNVLSTVTSEAAEGVLARQLRLLASGQLSPEIELDLMEAVEAGETDSLRLVLADIVAKRPANDALAHYQECLSGGNASSGRIVFFENAAASCRRCHQIGNEGGNAGPDLSAVGKDNQRKELLESILAPNAKIAKGFETVVLVTEDGLVHTGVLREENDQSVQLMTATGGVISVPKDQIEERARGKSGMPEEIVKGLSKRQLRDLVEFLSQQKTPAKSEGH